MKTSNTPGRSRLGLYGLCLLLSAGALVAEEVERDFHRTFDVAQGDRLHLEHGDGEVVIEAWERPQLDVTVRYRARVTSIGLARKPDFQVDFRQSGSTVHVIGRESGHSGIGFFAHRELEHLYTVRAPEWLILDLEGEDGDVEITGWRGEIKIRTEDGDLDLTDIRSPRTDLSVEDGDVAIDRLIGELLLAGEDGDLRVSDCTLSNARVRLEDGDAVLARCEGSARFELVDGDVTLERFRPDSVRVRTDDGDVELDLLATAEMDVEVRTADGDVFVDLAPGSSARFTIDTRDGGIRIDAPSAVEVSRRRNSATGTLGEGRGMLRIDTGDGRVVLREAS